MYSIIVLTIPLSERMFNRISQTLDEYDRFARMFRLMRQYGEYLKYHLVTRELPRSILWLHDPACDKRDLSGRKLYRYQLCQLRFLLGSVPLYAMAGFGGAIKTPSSESSRSKGKPSEPNVYDIDILTFTDPVALNQAYFDLTYVIGGGNSLIQGTDSRNGIHTPRAARHMYSIIHAANISC